MDYSLKFLAPIEHTRVCLLLEKYPCEYPNLMNNLQLVKILKISSKYIDLLEKIELYISKQAGFNLILINLPEFGCEKETDQIVKIGYPQMKDTLNQFGYVEKLEIILGHVYVKFDSPFEAYC